MPSRKPALGNLKDGTPLTEDLAERLADEAEQGYELSQGRRVGRPSLGGRAGSSPRVNFRISNGLHERALERARREGKTVSELAREALEDYVK
ncbi:MAG: hypothetical protein WBP81_25575 [Solirubrobacteraceae bacterium]